MPTLAEITTKRKELWVSALEAKKALTSTTPTPTGGATLPIAPQVQQPTTPTTQRIANRWDVVVWVNGEKFVQANNYDGSYWTAWVGTGQVVNQSGQAMSQMEQIQAEAFWRREWANIGQIPNKPMTEQDINAQYGGFIQKNWLNSKQPLPKWPTQLPAWTNEPVKAIWEGDAVLQQATEDAKNGIYRTPEFYSNLRKGLNPTPPPNADMMFSSILAKAPVPDDQKTTTQYKIAQNRYLKANSYASMTPSQLSSDITSGKLIEWSQTYEDIKSMNPKLVQDTNNLRIVNGSKVSLYSNDAQGNRVNNVEQSFTEDYLWDFWTFLKDLFKVKTVDEINAVIRTDEVKDAEAKADEYERELNAIEEWGLEIEKRVRSELEWSGASAERIRLEVAIAQEENDKKYNSVLKKYTQYANKANNLMTQNTTVYQESMKQQSAQQQALAWAAWQVFSSELAKEKSLYDAQLWLQTKQAEFEQWLAQQAEMAKDPTTAIWGILSQFQKLGITSDMDVAGHLASFKASGLSLPEYTKQMIENFKKKPEYTQAMARKNAEGTSYQTFGDKVYKMNPDGTLTETDIKIESKNTQDWAKLDDTTLYNQKTGELKKVSASEASGYWPSTTEVTPDAIKWMSSRLSWNNVQCGMVSNDYMAQKFPQAPRMWDSYESKVKSVEAIGVSDVPQVGGVFAMNTYNSNGHTWIVQSVDLAKWTFTATDANRAWSKDGWPVTTSTYKISDNLTFSKAPAWAWTIRPSDIDYFNSATATDKKKLSSNPQYVDFNNKKSAVMWDPNADIYEVMQYSQGGKDMWEERLKSLGKFSQGLSQVAELSKKVQETTTWPIIGRIRSYNPYDANAQALLAEINSVIPNIARGVYGEVGVLTDADIQNYAKTLPNIKSTEDTNKLVLAMTLKTMLNGFKWQIQIDGSAWRDVSGFVWTVKQYEDRINQLLSQLWWTTSPASNSNYNFQSDWENL